MRPPAGPGPSFLSFRFAILATLASVVMIAFMASRLRLERGPDEDDGAVEAEGGSVAAVLTGTAVVTGTAIDEAPVRDPRRVEFNGLLEGVSDFEDIAQNRAYAALASWVHNLTDDEAARIVNKKASYKHLVKAPGRWRGEYVQADGILIRMEPIRLAPGAGPPGVEDAWRGWLMEAGGEECFAFDVIGDAPDVSNREMVRVEGAFLKVLRYESEGAHALLDEKGHPVIGPDGRKVPDHTRDAPFLVARKAWRVEQREIEMPFRYDYVAVVLIAVLLAGVLLQRRWAANDKGLLELKRQELQRRLDQKKPKPPGDA